MKWYLNESHHPSLDDCVIRLKNKHNPDVFVFVVAKWNLSHKKWLFLSMEEYGQNYDLVPTHFAMIEPVPIDIEQGTHHE